MTMLLSWHSFPGSNQFPASKAVPNTICICVVQIVMDDAQLGSAEDVGLETFKQGAVLPEEEQPHATPAEQWAALAAALAGPPSISAISQVMREVCDAVSHEVTKEALSDACW